MNEGETPGKLTIGSYNMNLITNKNIDNNECNNEKSNYNKSLISYEDDTKLNIRFNLSTGLNVTLTCKKDITVEKLIQIFFQKFNYDFNNYDGSIYFLYNGQNLNVHSQEKIINILHNNALITVIDVQNLLATIDHFNLMTSDGKEYNISIPSKGNLFSLLKIYYEKLGKSVNESDFTFLKDIAFEDFIKKLSGSNK